jgi:thiamine kinase-like enzyme
MKHLLKEGEISLLLPEGEGGGLSGEVHLIKHRNEKYVVRRCDKLSKAKLYESLSQKFEKQGFLPRLLGRHGKDVFYEYVEGRDLTKKEKMDVFYQIGKICAQINKVKVGGSLDKRFKIQIKELETGKFKFNKKESERRKRNKVTNKPKPIFDKKKAKEIKKVYKLLKQKSRSVLTLDANDVAQGNFRIDKTDKVYFVDIEAIKSKVRGFGIGKFYLRWGKTPAKQKAFNKGYSSVSSLKFLTTEYNDFITLSFLMQRINYGVKIHNKDFFEKELELLDQILKKYS